MLLKKKKTPINDDPSQDNKRKCFALEANEEKYIS